jgi:hypothetical protein
MRVKFVYTEDEVERWRDRVHRRTQRRSVRTKRSAVEFINDVGFCFAFKAQNSEAPCLWHASCGERYPVFPRHTHHDPHISFVWKMKDILPAERKVYYGKLLKGRPTLVSLEYLPYFYVLSGRKGTAMEYLDEFRAGTLSPVAKTIVEALSDSSPQVTKGLKLACGLTAKSRRKEFDAAIAELQKGMFIVKVAEHDDPFTFEWDLVSRRFRKEVSFARKISEDQARKRLLQRYFRNQLLGTTASIKLLFGWNKQSIFRSLGQLGSEGIIIPNVLLKEKPGRYYALVA